MLWNDDVYFIDINDGYRRVICATYLLKYLNYLSVANSHSGVDLLGADLGGLQIGGAMGPPGGGAPVAAGGGAGGANLGDLFSLSGGAGLTGGLVESKSVR